MKKEVVVIFVLIGLIILGTGIFSWQILEKAYKKVAGTKIEYPQPEYTITVVIKPYQFGKRRECKGVWRPGLTVLEATKECDKVANLGLKLRYDPEIHKGYLVDEILGLRHTEENNRWWLYYVNNIFVTDKAKVLLDDPERVFEGKKPEPMPERFFLKPGDRVEWRFEEWGHVEAELTK